MTVTVLRRHRALVPAHVHQEPPAVTVGLRPPGAATDAAEAHLAGIPAAWRTDALRTALAERAAYDTVHAAAAQRAETAASREQGAALGARLATDVETALDLLTQTAAARRDADAVLTALGPRPDEPADPAAGRLAAADLDRAAFDVGTLARTRAGAELATWRAISPAFHASIAPPLTTPEDAAAERALDAIVEQARPLDAEVATWLSASTPATVDRLDQAAGLLTRLVALAEAVAAVRDQVAAADAHRDEQGFTWSHPDHRTLDAPAVRVLPLRQAQAMT